jgi:HEAT repeat protein
MSESADESRSWGERGVADLSGLLVELSRVQKGMGFYAEGDRARAQLLDRAFLAFQVELQRAGPLEIWIDEDHFRGTGLGETLPHSHMAELARALREREVERVEFLPGLSRDAFNAFADLMNLSDKGLEHCGGFARGLAARSNTGIRINGGEEDTLAAARSLSSTPAVSTASLGGALLARSRSLVVEGECEGEGEPQSDDDKPQLEDNPFEAPASDERGERLLFRLIELDRCTDDAAYVSLCTRIVDWAVELFDAELRDECYRAVLVLADHAVGEGGRSGVQAGAAQEQCLRLVCDARLDDLIERACSSQVSASVRATQVLLQLGGDQVVPRLFERLTATSDADQAAQLSAIIITLAESALPTLRRFIEDTNESQALLAARLAGELQNPAIVPTLAKALIGSRPALRREAARSLVHIGGEDAADALLGALSSELDQLAQTAAICLGHLREPRAAQAMVAGLERAVRAGDFPRAREFVRALGLLGSDRAVPKLVSLLERRALSKRKLWRELKLAILTALAKLSSREAKRALERTAESRDQHLRARAQRLLTGSNSARSPGAVERRALGSPEPASPIDSTHAAEDAEDADPSAAGEADEAAKPAERDEPLQ